MKFKNVDEGIFMKNSDPQANDLFVIVKKNGHQTPYLIVEFDNIFMLINLHSGQSNYSDININLLVNQYLATNRDANSTNSINPVTGYFFVKGYDVKISARNTFGYESYKI